MIGRFTISTRDYSSSFTLQFTIWLGVVSPIWRANVTWVVLVDRDGIFESLTAIAEIRSRPRGSLTLLASWFSFFGRVVLCFVSSSPILCQMQLYFLLLSSFVLFLLRLLPLWLLSLLLQHCIVLGFDLQPVELTRLRVLLEVPSPIKLA